MSLSDRIRPDCEASPWVIKEVKEMESRIEFWIEKSTMQAIQISGMETEIGKLKAENARYREALELIIKQFPKDYEVRITEIASEALKEIESNSRAIQIGKDLSEFKIRELESKLAKAKEALEFYADGEIVIAQKTDPKFSEIEKEMELLSDDFDVSVENGYWVKGKRARQALKGE